MTTAFVAMAGRDPDRRDADYLAWHALDHRPEMHRIAALRGTQRLVSTPACRAARAVSDGIYDAVDHVMTYLFAGRGGLEAMGALAGALGAAGRMPLRLPAVELGAYDLAGTAAAPRVLVGADVIPWRPARGAYVLVEQGVAPAGALTEVPGVAGTWWFRGEPASPPDGRGRPADHALLPGRRPGGGGDAAPSRPRGEMGRATRSSRGWRRRSSCRSSTTGRRHLP